MAEGQPASTIVLCDYDGTITLEDTGLAAMQELAPPEGMDIELAWRRGEMSSKECLRREFGLLDLTEDEFRAWVLSKPTDPHFPKFVRACRESGVAVAIVSDGLDLYIRWTLDKIGLSDIPFAANRARFEGRRLHVEFPRAAADCETCAHCKRDTLRQYRQRYQQVVYVGDGHSDRCAAEFADVLIAKGTLAAHCRAVGIHFVEFRDFGDVAQALLDRGLLQPESFPVRAG
jgi:2-hydroxy-3-keto-5-methylthiopentenyl-1-phosphate phosphatase